MLLKLMFIFEDIFIRFKRFKRFKPFDLFVDEFGYSCYVCPGLGRPSKPTEKADFNDLQPNNFKSLLSSPLRVS